MWLSCKESTCQKGDMGSTPGSGRSPGEGKGNPLQYSSLGNLMDRATWWARVHWGCRARHDLARHDRLSTHKTIPHCIISLWSLIFLQLFILKFVKPTQNCKNTMNSYMLYLDSQNVNILLFYFSGFFIANKEDPKF